MSRPVEDTPIIAAEPAPEAAATRPITTWVLLRVLWRSFFFLAAANYRRMQNVGFGYAMLPALERLYRGDALRAAMARHLEFFNSHPYMAGVILGAAIRIEEDVATGASPPERVQQLKRQMMGPLAAIGDSFFWTSLRPLGAVIAIAGLLAGVLWAPLAFLLVYNLCHLAMRAYGIFAGYARAELIVMDVNKLGLVRLADWAHVATGALLGVIAAQYADYARSQQPIGDGLEWILLAVLTSIAALYIKRRLPMLWLLYGLGAASAAFVVLLEYVFPILEGTGP